MLSDRQTANRSSGIHGLEPSCDTGTHRSVKPVVYDRVMADAAALTG
jgi:hypothetical protein